MTEIVLQPAKLSDAKAACDVVRRSICELCVEDHGNNEGRLAAWLANKSIPWFERIITSDRSPSVVAVEGNRILGFAQVNSDGRIALLYVYSSACSRGEGSASTWAPHSTYWLVLDGHEVVGVSNLRHCLTDKLRREGGHIGYGARPSARGRGHSRELLRQTLLRARAMGIEDVLITCEKTNVRSIATIRANGGALESEEFLPEVGKIVQRYWIRGAAS